MPCCFHWLNLRQIVLPADEKGEDHNTKGKKPASRKSDPPQAAYALLFDHVREKCVTTSCNAAPLHRQHLTICHAHAPLFIRFKTYRDRSAGLEATSRIASAT